MSNSMPTELPGDKLKKALKELSELVAQFPEKSRNQLLQKVEMKYDLSPKESEFLERNFSEQNES